MGRQQPLYISPTQFDVFKRIDAFFNIRDDTTSFSKILLPLPINFWLSAPELTSRLPIRFPCLSILIGGTLSNRSLLIILLIGSVCFTAPARFCRGLCVILLTHWTSHFLKNCSISTE